MKREELRALGLEEDVIEKIMTENGKEVQKMKSDIEKYKADADEASELRKKLDEIEQINLSEVEKAQKELEKANARISELEKKEAVANRKADAMAKFKISKEQADKVIGEDGNIDFDALGTIISEKETASANAKEKELANGASNPNGGGGSGTNGEEKTEAETIAESIGKSISEANKASQSVVESYL